MKMATSYDTALIDNEDLVQVCEEHGLDVDAFIVYCDNYHILGDFADSVNDFTDAYCGYYYNFTDYATELFDDTMDVPDHLVHYIDYEAFARDLLLSGDYWENMGYVFRNF